MSCVKTRDKKTSYIPAVGLNPSVIMCAVQHERHNSGPRPRTEMLNTILETAMSIIDPKQPLFFTFLVISTLTLDIWRMAVCNLNWPTPLDLY